MIRYSNSFFLSLIFHSSLLLSVWFFYNNEAKPEQETPLKIPLKLSMIEAASQTTAEHQTKEEVCIVKPQESKPKQAEEKPKKKIEKKIEKREDEKVEQKKEEHSLKEIAQKSEIVAEPQKSVAQEVHKKIASEQKTVPPPVEAKPYHQEYSELNAQKIVELLKEHLYYPRSARQKGIVGVVKVKFTIDVDAKVYNITIVESSDEILSRAAIKTIEELSTKFPKPASKTTLSVPINYSLISE
ncbi:MAG: TonB family protein [Sulfurimonas sp.]|nr:TonB family protein [Sulfurimonas sp.]